MQTVSSIKLLEAVSLKIAQRNKDNIVPSSHITINRGLTLLQYSFFFKILFNLKLFFNFPYRPNLRFFIVL